MEVGRRVLRVVPVAVVVDVGSARAGEVADLTEGLFGPVWAAEAT